MINNDVLRSIRYMLDLGDPQVLEIAQLADRELALGPEAVHAYLKKEDAEGFVECPDRVLAHFLDGLVVHRRGRQEGAAPRPVEKRINNNLVLKKLRIAFELRDEDMHQAFADAGMPVGKPELSAFFRQPEHRNYRACGDQLLRNFLKGLTVRLRPG